jgi:dCTP deaminase
MGVLHESEIKARMGRSKYEDRLLVTPLLDESQIGPASIDIRLGSSIIIPQKTYSGSHDVTDKSSIREVERRMYDRRTLQYHSRFTLHPNQLILAVTLEYISLPFDVSCVIASRSSWGRLGLIVATAAMVQPGYKGCLTLELANLSEGPIALYPGLPVGQLIFYDVLSHGGKRSYEGRYECPTEAEFPKFFTKDSDKELEFWSRKNQP